MAGARSNKERSVSYFHGTVKGADKCVCKLCLKIAVIAVAATSIVSLLADQDNDRKYA